MASLSRDPDALQAKLDAMRDKVDQQRTRAEAAEAELRELRNQWVVAKTLIDRLHEIGGPNTRAAIEAWRTS